ncbi:MAG TPA: substrate-binding domain-containing protein, partial [Clostridiaceae bacterium]|nr:substrate-binding domain-containing protein [Clostridiaceae bacterium]
KVYGLEFIPVCEEEYDFIVSKEALETDLVKDFVRILESPAFESKLMELGGYRLVDTGKIVEIEDTV